VAPVASVTGEGEGAARGERSGEGATGVSAGPAGRAPRRAAREDGLTVARGGRPGGGARAERHRAAGAPPHAAAGREDHGAAGRRPGPRQDLDGAARGRARARRHHPGAGCAMPCPSGARCVSPRRRRCRRRSSCRRSAARAPVNLPRPPRGEKGRGVRRMKGQRACCGVDLFKKDSAGKRRDGHHFVSYLLFCLRLWHDCDWC
jgi:hypothetical protein